MKFLSRPGFYAILLLIALMLLLTLWLQWKIDSLPKRKAKQEAAPALQQPLLLEVHDGQDR